MDFKKEVEKAKNNMTWGQYTAGFFKSLYWLSPIGYLHNKDQYYLYWYILYHI